MDLRVCDEYAASLGPLVSSKLARFRLDWSRAERDRVLAAIAGALAKR
jgi:hypothetical protein